MSFSSRLDWLGKLLVKDGKKNWPAIALVYLIILFPIAFLAVYSAFKSRQDLTRAVKSQRSDLAYLAAATFQERLNRLADLSISLASRVRFRQMVSASRWQEASEILRAVPRDFPFIDSYFLTDVGGTVTADFPPASAARDRNFADRDWYQAVSQHWKPYISDVYQSSAARRSNVIAVATPVQGDAGETMAILVLQVKLDSLREWIGGIDAGERGAVLVVDRKGRLVAHPNHEPQGQILDLSANAAVQKALRGNRGLETFVNPASGGEELAAYAPIAGYGWAVVVQQPTHAAYASRDQALLLTLTTDALVFLLNCALAYVILVILIRVKRAEKDRSQLAAIVECSDDAILSKTLDGAIVTWNKGAERIYGYTEGEIKGQSINILVPEDHAGETETILARIACGEVVARYETERKTKTGHKIDVSLTVSPIRDANGKIVGASAIGRNISDRKKLRRELEDKNRILEEQYNVVREANRLKSEFLANMSHELRTPLNAIIGFAQLMHDGKIGPVSSDHKEYLGDILTSGRRLLELINDLLDLARMESGKMEFHPEAVNVPQLIVQVRAILQSVAASKRLAILTEIAPEIEEVVIDPAKLKQVLYNYLSNALKFTPSGGKIYIRVLAENADKFRLEVQDTGSGIGAEQIGELFVEFRQLEPGLSKKYQGTGLGLALTKKIVEAQGGRVGVHTAPGQGSLFFAVLPRHASPSAETKPGPVTASAASFGPRILVVEDDDRDLEWLGNTLSRAGYVVDSASSGSNAVVKAQTIAYDAVLLDLILPDMVGWEVLKSIRESAFNRDVPVIVLTVVSEPAAAKDFALQDYLPKPVSAGALLGSLRRAGVIGSGTGKKILVVDDDPGALRLASAALESSGYEASCHSSATSALKEAAQGPVDAVVVDLLMPGIDGFEFLQRLRSLENNTATPVIIWTGKTITIAEREKLKGSANSIALKGQGGIEAVLRELRYHVRPEIEAAP